MFDPLFLCLCLKSFNYLHGWFNRNLDCFVIDEVLGQSYTIIDNQCPDSSLDVHAIDHEVAGTHMYTQINYLNFKFTDSLDTEKTEMKLKCSVS